MVEVHESVLNKNNMFSYSSKALFREVYFRPYALNKTLLVNSNRFSVKNNFYRYPVTYTFADTMICKKNLLNLVATNRRNDFTKVLTMPNSEYISKYKVTQIKI